MVSIRTSTAGTIVLISARNCLYYKRKYVVYKNNESWNRYLFETRQLAPSFPSRQLKTSFSAPKKSLDNCRQAFQLPESYEKTFEKLFSCQKILPTIVDMLFSSQKSLSTTEDKLFSYQKSLSTTVDKLFSYQQDLNRVSQQDLGLLCHFIYWPLLCVVTSNICS